MNRRTKDDRCLIMGLRTENCFADMENDRVDHFRTLTIQYASSCLVEKLNYLYFNPFLLIC